MTAHLNRQPVLDPDLIADAQAGYSVMTLHNNQMPPCVDLTTGKDYLPFDYATLRAAFADFQRTFDTVTATCTYQGQEVRLVENSRIMHAIERLERERREFHAAIRRVREIYEERLFAQETNDDRRAVERSIVFLTTLLNDKTLFKVGLSSLEP